MFSSLFCKRAASSTAGSSSMNLKTRFSEPSITHLKPLILVTSIGNPSPKYDGTRHSVGHYMLDQYMKQENINDDLKLGKYKYKYNKIDHPNFLFFKCDDQFMNLSGGKVSKIWSDLLQVLNGKRNPILVVLHDELDLPLGELKVRKQNSSHRGHNGLRSIQDKLGKGYTAVQVGIGRNYGGGNAKDSKIVADYVLGKFKADELEVLQNESVVKFTQILNDMDNGKYIFDKL